ncbi:FAD-dependent oxidoreductase [Eggerthellaceae bacterium zg-1084]|uniref:FAD-dependent oxidoreductase n=1 Tax=Berryella wangjianweii TaxID=2734634 RepID=UPI0015523531|nr:FAD-dependent oxidoreductase [Berryella wangjianweii]NPD31539.1 FAD-dependent oxidoreductase [Berryella wangjianweii]NPD32966.1 FAD-dependent oxidoreductase [Eggerthellaceae bacterium zg-997]
MADFEAIVVGSGCAGSVAAYELARAGKSVLVIERGNFAGAKNMTGGRIYSHSLKEVFPSFEENAPLERKVVRERISMIDQKSCMTMEFSSDELEREGQDSYTVLRATFDPWLAEQAEEAGAEFIYGIAVESLMKDEKGAVCGVKAGEDEITADVVILCDGVNSLLAQEAVGFDPPSTSTMAVGIKQVIQLDEETITNRCLTASSQEGTAWLFAGDSTHGRVGGGFMYANKDTISLGLVATLSDLEGFETPIYQMLEDFKRHPVVAPIIRGGKVIEHSGHMVPEGGLNMMPALTADGVMLAGESAMMCVNLGYVVRGMDYAIAAGMHAGRCAAAALDAGDTSKAGLAGYEQALEGSFVMKDLRQVRNFPAVMEHTTRLYHTYPRMIGEMLNGMFVVDGKPIRPMKSVMLPILKKVGFMNLLKDARGMMKAL